MTNKIPWRQVPMTDGTDRFIADFRGFFIMAQRYVGSQTWTVEIDHENWGSGDDLKLLEIALNAYILEPIGELPLLGPQLDNPAWGQF